MTLHRLFREFYRSGQNRFLRELTAEKAIAYHNRPGLAELWKARIRKGNTGLYGSGS